MLYAIIRMLFYDIDKSIFFTSDDLSYCFILLPKIPYDYIVWEEFVTFLIN